MHQHRFIYALLIAALVAVGWAGVARNAPSDTPLGLFTSLPIMWGEGTDLAAEIGGAEPPHWARQVLARHGRVVPLDLLSDPALAKVKRLILAQPRPLAPEENVALDRWVRRGGRVLLFADPALTFESSLTISDPRRPQAMVLLSPILTHWGLELRFDDAQPIGAVQRDVLGAAMPVNLPGKLVLLPASACKLTASGLAADCRIGKGRVVVIADAALLEPEDPDASRRAGLAALIETSLQ